MSPALRAVALVLILCGAGPAVGEEGPPARQGDEGIFQLARGGTIAGRLLSTGPEGDRVRLRSGQIVTLKPGSVVAYVGPYEEVRAPPGKGASTVRLLLRDGRTVEGDLVSRGEGHITLRTEGREERYDERQVRGVYEYASLLPHLGGPPDPARLRHVHAPVAWGAGSGELFAAASTEGLELKYGLGGGLSASAAIATPVVVEGALVSPTYVLGGEVHHAFLPWLGASAGVSGHVHEAGTSAYLSGSLTAGTPDAHLTLHAGPPAPGAGQLGHFGGIVLALAGTARVSARVVASAETWVSTGEQRDVAAALSLRWIGGAWALGAGAEVAAEGWRPWASFTWAWGGRR